MGDLIVMSRGKPRPMVDKVAGGSAEILFFTGVRYYRADDVAAVTAKAPRPKRVSGDAKGRKRTRVGLESPIATAGRIEAKA